ncbi:MAG: SAM-dependent methyltransferase [Bacteriovoracaceae bacterium]|jgi:SAM-dependent methyltransferase|nr:SAM-dependent methyltransferase [Bacteriovoracaceae bacterium]
MNKAQNLVKELMESNSIESIVISSPKVKSNETKSIHINQNKDQSYTFENRFLKHNSITNESCDFVLKQLLNNALLNYKQVLIKAGTNEHQILIGKKNTKIISKQAQSKKVTSNKKKKYFIEDGSKCDFLVAIGVMDKKYKVKSNFYKKFKQINRFLEMIDDLYKNTQTQGIHIVDFGCGKSYLTFAVYHYFKFIKKTKSLSITGVDLKQDVIDHCNDIATNLKFDELKFVHGFIHNFKQDKKVDFVITLHACDTATDEAILFSIKNKADKMIFVPCCQHELNKQMKNDENKALIESGIYRDRFCTILTDTLRSKYLEAHGYKVQTMEFIDMEHTAKNVMLRCQKILNNQKKITIAADEYKKLSKNWNVKQYLSDSI